MSNTNYFSDVALNLKSTLENLSFLKYVNVDEKIS